MTFSFRGTWRGRGPLSAPADDEAMTAADGLDAAVAGALGAGIDPEDLHANEASISFSSMSAFDQTFFVSSCSSSGLHQPDHLLRRLAFELDVVLRQHRDFRRARLDVRAP